MDGAYASPSSEAMSVIRDDMMLGAAVDSGCELGKAGSRGEPDMMPGRFRDPLEPSGDVVLLS